MNLVRFERHDGLEIWINPLQVEWLVQSEHEGNTLIAFPGDLSSLEVKGEVLDIYDRLTDA